MAQPGLLEGFLSAGIAGFALLLAVVALASWRRVGGAKLLSLALAFLLFAAKGAWLTLPLLAPLPQSLAPPSLGPALLAVDLAVLVLLYAASVR